MHGASFTPFQAQVARVFFGLPEARSFLLAGGLALAAHGLTDRPTEDLDAFTSRAGDVHAAYQAFAQAAIAHGWRVEVRQSTDTFVRLVVTGDESLLVDLALDSAPGLPPTMSVLGPTFAIDELAARKLLALFDRAMPRDFVDVYRLTRTLPAQRLIRLAESLDPGLDKAVLALAMRQLDRYRDEDIPIKSSEVVSMRQFFQEWASELR